MLSSDYNVLRSTVIAMNNFIQCSHCQSVHPFRLTLFLIKALTTIIFKYIVHPCVRFSDQGSCLKLIKMRATPFSSFSCWNNFFYDCQCLKCTDEQRRLHENHVAYRLALIHSTCNWNLQSELNVTHENTPTALPRFNNVIFLHHNVMQKNSGCIETEKSYLCKVLHFNSQNLTLIGPPNDYRLQLMEVTENTPLNIKK